MMIARWKFHARFGHKQDALNLLKRWNKEIGSQIGWTKDKVRITTGSIGALESSIESEISISGLGELNDSFEKLETIDAHNAWGREMEPHIVSGTSQWEIYRVI